MSETDPVLKTFGTNGYVPTALEVIYDLIIEKTPGCTPGTDVTMQYDTDTPGLVRFVSELPGQVEVTNGRAVALEIPRIVVQIRGNPTDYGTPKAEAIRLRYVIAAQGEYVSRGLRMLDASPVGSFQPMGRDVQNREAIQIEFDVMTEPSYE